jgi:AcrR family transcriptional regulator
VDIVYLESNHHIMVSSDAARLGAFAESVYAGLMKTRKTSVTARRQPPKTSAKRTAALPRRDLNLRLGLLRATEEILSEQGLDKFTLREAARRSGVSHGAPAFHFGDSAGLLTAYAAEGFNAMTNLMLRYRSEAKRDRKSQLVAVGLAYVDYAVEHRASFQLMFRSDRLKTEDLYFKEASKRAFEQLKEVVTPFLAQANNEQERMMRLLWAWSLVHGFATLVLEGHLAHFQGGAAATDVAHQRARALIERFVAGWSSEGP